MNIDLTELAKRESERVEWKENVASIDDVVRTVVALSNDYLNLGGGYVVCGAREGRDEAGFQKVFFEGLTSSRFKEIEGKVLADCREKVDPPIAPRVEEIGLPDAQKRVLVFVVPATDYAHCYRSTGKDASTFYVRIGRETREAKNGLLRELLVRKKALEPWDRRPNANASLKDIDLIVLRDYLQSMELWDPNKALEDYLSASHQIATFVPPLAAARGVANELIPRNFTLLLFCSKPTFFFPGAFSVFSVYPGTDRGDRVAEKVELAGPVVEQAKKLIERLNTESYTAFDKTSLHPNQLKYPQRALQEAVVNAIVHRDYESDQPVRVTVFSDRIEINSPGPLPRAIDHKRFVQGKAAPYWRNQSLAYFFNKLQLAQAEGQGIATILRTMHDSGCPDPIFQIGDENLICIIPAHPWHQQIKDLQQIENNIILGNHRDAFDQLEAMLSRDPYNFRSIELFCEVCNKIQKPESVLKFIQSHDIRPDSINPACLIFVAETLLAIRNNDDAKRIAQRFIGQASNVRLEEAEIRKVALSFRKLGDNVRAIQFIDDAMDRMPSLSHNSALLEIRAKAKIDLAKICMDTARQRNSSPKIQGKAWDECRKYLTEAEGDLFRALDSASFGEKDFIERDIDFLRRMQSIARKPERRRK